jgi:ATP synthase protein I
MRMRSVPGRIVLWQCLTGLIVSAAWLLGGAPEALAALAGGFGSALLSFHFSARVFSRTDKAPPQAIVAAFYRAEAFKLLSAAVMFGLVAKYFPELFVPFLSAFAATLLVFFAALLWQVEDAPGGRGKTPDDAG